MTKKDKQVIWNRRADNCPKPDPHSICAMLKLWQNCLLKKDPYLYNRQLDIQVGNIIYKNCKLSVPNTNEKR